MASATPRRRSGGGTRSRSQYLIRSIYARETCWCSVVDRMSALRGDGLTGLWSTVRRHRQVLTDAGEFEVSGDVERRVRDGEMTPALAAQQILDAAR